MKQMDYDFRDYEAEADIFKRLDILDSIKKSELAKIETELRKQLSEVDRSLDDADKRAEKAKHFRATQVQITELNAVLLEKKRECAKEIRDGIDNRSLSEAMLESARNKLIAAIVNDIRQDGARVLLKNRNAAQIEMIPTSLELVQDDYEYYANCRARWAEIRDDVLCGSCQMLFLLGYNIVNRERVNIENNEMSRNCRQMIPDAIVLKTDLLTQEQRNSLASEIQQQIDRFDGDAINDLEKLSKSFGSLLDKLNYSEDELEKLFIEIASCSTDIAKKRFAQRIEQIERQRQRSLERIEQNLKRRPTETAHADIERDRANAQADRQIKRQREIFDDEIARIELNTSGAMAALTDNPRIANMLDIIVGRDKDKRQLLILYLIEAVSKFQNKDVEKLLGINNVKSYFFKILENVRNNNESKKKDILEHPELLEFFDRPIADIGIERVIGECNLHDLINIAKQHDDNKAVEYLREHLESSLAKDSDIRKKVFGKRPASATETIARIKTYWKYLNH
ncbi:MAG TPA: hypothetical protein PKH33_12720 [bacterium]|nr:hypothetical protein [bacterium]